MGLEPDFDLRDDDPRDVTVTIADGDDGVGLLLVAGRTGPVHCSRIHRGAGHQPGRSDALMGVLGIAIGVGCACSGFDIGTQDSTTFDTDRCRRLDRILYVVGFDSGGQDAGASMFEVATSMTSFLIFVPAFLPVFTSSLRQCCCSTCRLMTSAVRFLGTANAVSFTFMTVAALVYWAIRPGFGDRPSTSFSSVQS